MVHHPAQAKPIPVPMGWKVLVNQRRQFHPLHLFEEQWNILDALGDNVAGCRSFPEHSAIFDLTPNLGER